MSTAYRRVLGRQPPAVPLRELPGLDLVSLRWWFAFEGSHRKAANLYCVVWTGKRFRNLEEMKSRRVDGSVTDTWRLVTGEPRP